MATLVYQEGGKQYHPEKRLITHHDENKQHVAPGQNRTQTTLVEGKQSHAWGGEGRGGEGRGGEGILTCDKMDGARHKI